MRDDYYDYDPITYELRNKNRDDVLRELNEIDVGASIALIITVTIVTTLLILILAGWRWGIFSFIFSLLVSSLLVYLNPSKKGDW